jgi:hypothetical protein
LSGQRGDVRIDGGSHCKSPKKNWLNMALPPAETMPWG